MFNKPQLFKAVLSKYLLLGSNESLIVKFYSVTAP